MTSTRPLYRDGLAIYESTASAGGAHVVLVHGSMDRAAAFRKAVRQLRDVDITLYDRRGYARSLDAGTAETMDQLVADLLTVIDARPTVVVGHSLGAVIALSAACHAPDVISAVGAFEAPMGWRPWWPSTSAGGVAREAAAAEGPEAAAEQFMRRLVGDERWTELPEGTRRQRRAEGRALLADLTAMRTGGEPFDVTTLDVPVVAGYGSATSDRHRRAARELAAEASECELVVIEDAPHGAHYSHPEQFASFVRRAISRAA